MRYESDKEYIALLHIFSLFSHALRDLLATTAIKHIDKIDFRFHSEQTEYDCAGNFGA